MIYQALPYEIDDKSCPENVTSSLTRSVSPPVVSRSRTSKSKSSTALVEAGEKEVEDHLAFFSEKLQAVTLSESPGVARLSHSAWTQLYTRNLNSSGHRFVVHQHDHPVAGTHYDLRLQCNATSSISFAIMYGLPGDPNSRRLNRNATETRVHNLWNHLIETASHQTGTMLLWDTGEYEVLPYQEQQEAATTTDDEYASDYNIKGVNAEDKKWASMTEQQKLRAEFQHRKIRLRLNGRRLPSGYTISLRLTNENFRSKQPATPKKRRRKGDPSKRRQNRQQQSYNTDSSTSADEAVTRSTRNRLHRSVSSLSRQASPPSGMKSEAMSSPNTTNASSKTRKYDKSPSSSPSITHCQSSINIEVTTETHPHSDDEAESSKKSELEIQRSNAYPGATNDINSIHQRRWFLSLDRKNSGFIQTRFDSNLPRNANNDVNSQHMVKRWVARSSIAGADTLKDGISPGFDAFHVLGRDHERSILTGRLATDILHDEGVQGYIPRGLWRAVTE